MDIKDYHKYDVIQLGSSDGALLIWTSGENVGTIHFGEDGNYKAYLVDEKAEIGEHYSLVAEGKNILTIYDDDGRVFRDRAKIWKIYRAGMRGCIIQIIDRY